MLYAARARQGAVLRRACSWWRGFAHQAAAAAAAANNAPHAPQPCECYSLDVPEGRLVTSTVHLPASKGSQGAAIPATATAAADAALGVAWRSLTLALGPHHQRPTFLLLFSSAPSPLASHCLATLSQLAGSSAAGRGDDAGSAGASPSTASPVPLAGCTTQRWTPAGCGGSSRISSSSAGSARGAAPAAPVGGHITLAAASLPGMSAHVFHTTHDSLPALSLPLVELLQAQPQLLLFTSAEEQGAEEHCSTLMQRFDNLMPGASILGALACSTHTGGAAIRPLMAAAVEAAISGRIAAPDADGEGEAAQRVPAGRSRMYRTPRSAADMLQRRRAVAEAVAATAAARKAAALVAEIGMSVDEESEGMEGAEFLSASESLVFTSDKVHASGSAGVLLLPQAPEWRLSPASSAALVRLLCACNRMGDSLGQWLVPQQSVLQHLQPPPSGMDSYQAPPMHQPLTWAPAVVLPDNLEAHNTSTAATTPTNSSSSSSSEDCGSASSSDPQQPGDLPLFVVDALQHGGRLWPGMALALRVFERRYLLLAKACIEGNADHPHGGVFGLAAGGYGTAASIQACKASQDHSHLLLVGGRRFRCPPEAARVLPASFGLSAAQVEWLDDKLPAEGTPAAERLRELATQVAWVLLRVSRVQRREPAADAAADTAADTATGAPEATSSISTGTGEHGNAPGSTGSSASADSSASSAGSDEPGSEELQAWLDRELTPQLASELSLVLAACLPVDGAVKEAWFQGTDAAKRLEQQVQVMLLGAVAARAAAVFMSKLQPEHPLASLTAVLGVQQTPS